MSSCPPERVGGSNAADEVECRPGVDREPSWWRVALAGLVLSLLALWFPYAVELGTVFGLLLLWFVGRRRGWGLRWSMALGVAMTVSMVVVLVTVAASVPRPVEVLPISTCDPTGCPSPR